MKVIKGDLLKAKEDIIIHQVNCQGAYGAGLAKQIANKYPKAKKEYVRSVSYTHLTLPTIYSV